MKALIPFKLYIIRNDWYLFSSKRSFCVVSLNAFYHEVDLKFLLHNAILMAAYRHAAMLAAVAATDETSNIFCLATLASSSIIKFRFFKKSFKTPIIKQIFYMILFFLLLRSILEGSFAYFGIDQLIFISIFIFLLYLTFSIHWFVSSSSSSFFRFFFLFTPTCFLNLFFE